MARPTLEGGPAAQVLPFLRSTNTRASQHYTHTSLDSRPRRVLRFSCTSGCPMNDIDTTEQASVPDALIAEHLRASRGNITKAGQSLTDAGHPIRRATLKNRIDKSVALREILTELRDEVLDQAETNVFDDVFAKDSGASRFVLSTLGKDRGWVTRVENENKKPIEVTIRDVIGDPEKLDGE